MDKDKQNVLADLVTIGGRDLAKRSSKLVRRGLDSLFSPMLEDTARISEHRIRTIVVNCVPERGRLIVDQIAQEIDIYIVGEASNGADGLALFEQLHPELVLTCIGLKFMSGLDLISKIKEKRPETRIVVTTIQGSQKEEAFRRGADGFVTLPPASGELAEVVKEAME